jgi:hypothetical protein
MDESGTTGENCCLLRVSGLSGKANQLAMTTGRRNSDSAWICNRIIKIAFAFFLVGVALLGLLPRLDPNGANPITFVSSMLMVLSPITMLVAAAHRDGALRGPLPLKQWFRFSMLTLLIATTLIAATIGWMIFWNRK